MTKIRTSVRATTRHAALDALSTVARLQPPARRALGRPRVHFVYLHAVPQSQESRFSGHLDRLLSEHTPISYSDAVQRVTRGEIDKPYVCFSFDDGFASSSRTATLLSRRGISACFFVPTGFVGCSSVGEARQFFRTSDGVDETALTWGDLEAIREQGHEVGNHTVTHPDLGRAPPAQIEEEVGWAATELRQRLGDCLHFAWPLGRWRNFTPDARASVWRAGHISCASAERGAHTSSPTSPTNLCLRREHVVADWPWSHVRYFMARSSRGSEVTTGAWPQSWERDS